MKKIILIFIALSGIIVAQGQVQIGADIDGEALNDNAGRSVSMPDAGTVAIGAPENDGAGTDAGHVRIYTLSGNDWVQKGEDIDGEAISDFSGWAVSMPDANTVAIGAPYNDESEANAGHVRIYTWNGSGWVQKGADIDGESAGDQSGMAVSMPDANTVAIGAPRNGGSGTFAGHVRIYTWNGSSWMQKGVDIDGDSAGDNSGRSVSMPDANTVAIGGPNNGENGTNAGHVRVYTWSGNAWVQRGMDIHGESAGDYSGWSVSMSDTHTVAIGAYHHGQSGSSPGHVRVYNWRDSAWVQKGSDIHGEADEDLSGWSVSMPDPNNLAIGARKNDGTDDEAGHVRIFSWIDSAWVQIGADLDGEAGGDWFGYSVSMPDANNVAIGAPKNGGNGQSAGHIRVFGGLSSLGIEKAVNKQNSFIQIYPNPSKGLLPLSAWQIKTRITR